MHKYKERDLACTADGMISKREKKLPKRMHSDKENRAETTKFICLSFLHASHSFSQLSLPVFTASMTGLMVNSSPVQFFFLFTSFVLTVVFRRPSDMEGGMDRLCISCCTSLGSFNISFIVKSTLQKWTTS